MFRFLALVWQPLSDNQIQHVRRIAALVALKAPEMQQVFSGQGLLVFLAKDTHGVFGVYRSPDQRGVILGKLFRRCDDESVASPVEFDLAPDTSREGGQDLLRNYWGRYIAFISDPVRSSLIVQPDPTGEVPCYYAQTDGVTLLFTSLADVAPLGLLHLSINWRYIATCLVKPNPQCADTGFNEISQLRSGEALHFDSARRARHSLCWDLAEIAAEDPIEDFDSAAALAREKLLSCIGAWSDCYPQIVHTLSGGIDSAIVLAALLHSRHASEHIECLNLHDPTVGGDERRFARMTASAILSASGRPTALIERARDVEQVQLDALSALSPSACPFGYLACAAYRSFYVDATSARRAVLTTGFGGDYIFYRTSRAEPAIDYVYRHGLGKDLLNIVQANTGNSTYWSVLYRALSVGLLRRDLPRGVLPGEQAFVSRDVIESVEHGGGDGFKPPWAQSPAFQQSAIPPNKRRQLESMYRPVRMHDPFESSSATPLTWCSPLLSQPVVELFARIPVYVLKHGGVERAVARRAFAKELPRAIVERRSKGVTNNFMHCVFRRHEAFFRATLLEGRLAQEGLLDRAQLEVFFENAQDGHAEGMSNIVGHHIDLEAWLRMASAL